MDANLRNRVLTAAVLIPLVVGAVLWLPTGAFAAGAAVFVLAGAWEWSAMVGWPGRAARAAWVVGTAGVLAGTGMLLATPGAAAMLLVAGCAWWCVALAWVVNAQQGRMPGSLAGVRVRVMTGLLTLVPAWAGLVHLHRLEGGPALVLSLLVLVWLADSGAYFAGRRFGRHRLASRVSPGKSWEGVAGGLVAVVAGAAGFAVAARPVESSTGFVALCALVCLLSVLGDLLESMLKRRAGLKDSGTLIPGHGGALDRIDSITAASPFFALGLIVLGAST